MNWKFWKKGRKIGGRKFNSLREFDKCFKCGKAFGDSTDEIGYLFHEGAFHADCEPKEVTCPKCGTHPGHLQGYPYSDSLQIMFCEYCREEFNAYAQKRNGEMQ